MISIKSRLRFFWACGYSYLR